MQPKSSNASVFFFLVETPVEINTWLLSFHQMHHTSLSSSSSTQTSLATVINVITINRAIAQYRLLTSFMSQLAIRHRLIRATLFWSWHPLSLSLKSNECSVSLYYHHNRNVFSLHSISTLSLYSNKHVDHCLHVYAARQPAHWPRFLRSDDENMTSEWHCNVQCCRWSIVCFFLSVQTSL